jgi:hypothetical protein
MAWVKAWIFAFIHASTVSLVMGSITFFEDMLRANEEIERTGTVSFPKQLLPGTVTGSAVRKRLSQPSGDSKTGDEVEESGQSAKSSSKAVKWEVVDVLDEAGDANDD